MKRKPGRMWMKSWRPLDFCVKRRRGAVPPWKNSNVAMPRRLWHMIQRHNALGINPLEAVRVGDIEELPLRSIDPDILEWSDRNEHILVTLDKTTMPQFFQQRISAGLHHPGMFLIK